MWQVHTSAACRRSWASAPYNHADPLARRSRAHLCFGRMSCRLGHGPHYSEAMNLEKTGNNAKTKHDSRA